MPEDPSPRMQEPSEYDAEREYDPFVEALGVYVGTTTREELEQALHGHTTGPVIERTVAADRRVLSQRSGWVEYVDALGFYVDHDKPGRFVLHNSTHPFEQNPTSGQWETRPKSEGDLELPDGELERYTGGFAIRKPDGGTVWLSLWHATLHLTETGDVAPGFGETKLTIEHDESDE